MIRGRAAAPPPPPLIMHYDASLRSNIIYSVMMKSLGLPYCETLS